MATRTVGSPLVLTSLLACLGGCGAAGDPPPGAPFSHPLLVEANAHVGGPLAGAEVLEPAAFAALLDKGEAVLMKPGAPEDELGRLAAEEAATLARARQIFVDDPRVLAMLDQLPLPDGEDAERLPDGSVLYRGIREDADAGRAPRFFLLRGVGPGLEDALEAKPRFESADTQHGIYTQMDPGLPAVTTCTNSPPTGEGAAGSPWPLPPQAGRSARRRSGMTRRVERMVGVSLTSGPRAPGRADV